MAAKARRVESEAEVKAAVDELLGAFSAPEGSEPDDQTAFSDERAKKLADGERPGRSAPSADVDSLWGGKPKKK